jgi:hypothetical protein
MSLLGYSLLLVVSLAHVAYLVRSLVKLRTEQVAWNFNVQGVLSVVMLLLIAIVNAIYATNTHLSAGALTFFKVLFGAGCTGGILQLGLGGIYWAGVAVFSAIVMFKAPSRTIVGERPKQKLPPGGLWTVAGCMLLLAVLLGIMVWGLRP